MTGEQREKITQMRREGAGYSTIAEAIGIPKDTVKTFCQQNGIGGNKAPWAAARDGKHCPECGMKLEQTYRAKPKRFCSDACRRAWWNHHQKQLRSEKVRNFVCEKCGKTFTAYGSSNRKYCCYDCYAAMRYGKPTSRTAPSPLKIRP